MEQAVTTVAEAFARAARTWPRHAFVQVLEETAGIYGIPAGELRYSEALEQVEALRRAYAAAGYQAGMRIGLLLGNRPDFLLHWFALNGLGLSIVPINADLRGAELEYLIDHAEIVLAIAPAERAEALLAAAAAVGRVIACSEPGGAIPPAPATAPPTAGIPANPEEREAALLYTSGTTGRPKGCVLDNRYFLEAGRWYTARDDMAALRPGEERMLSPLPLVHMNALAYSTMAMLMSGGCLILLDRFHPSTWWASVHASRATVVHYLGVMPAMLMKAAPTALERGHALRFGFGAGVDRRLHADFEQRFGFPLLEAWAMTETGAGAVVIADREPRKIGSHCFGRPGAGVELRVVAEGGREAQADEPGELWVRHAGADPRHGFFRGYLKDPEATAAAWAGGWFRTGDIVSRDADGDLHFIDRNKNVIRRSGENISALEVESVLLQHPRVRTAAVAAVPDPLRGDEVLACIVSEGTPPADAHERQALAAEIVATCLQRLAYYKAPGHVAFVEALPLTSSQKVQRAELRRLAESLAGSPGCVDTRALKKRQD